MACLAIEQTLKRVVLNANESPNHHRSFSVLLRTGLLILVSSFQWGSVTSFGEGH